jgi:hypothetical protein
MVVQWHFEGHWGKIVIKIIIFSSDLIFLLEHSFGGSEKIMHACMVSGSI